MRSLVTILGLLLATMSAPSAVAGGFRAATGKACFILDRFNIAISEGRTAAEAERFATIPCSSFEAVTTRQIENAIILEGVTVSDRNCSRQTMLGSGGLCVMTVTAKALTNELYATPGITIKIPQGVPVTLRVSGKEIVQVDRVINPQGGGNVEFYDTIASKLVD